MSIGLRLISPSALPTKTNKDKIDEQKTKNNIYYFLCYNIYEVSQWQRLYFNNTIRVAIKTCMANRRQYLYIY